MVGACAPPTPTCRQLKLADAISPVHRGQRFSRRARTASKRPAHTRMAGRWNDEHMQSVLADRRFAAPSSVTRMGEWVGVVTVCSSRRFLAASALAADAGRVVARCKTPLWRASCCRHQPRGGRRSFRGTARLTDERSGSPPSSCWIIGTAGDPPAAPVRSVGGRPPRRPGDSARTNFLGRSPLHSRNPALRRASAAWRHSSTFYRPGRRLPRPAPTPPKAALEHAAHSW